MDSGSRSPVRTGSTSSTGGPMSSAGEGCGATLGRTPFACDRRPHPGDPRHETALVFPESGPAMVEWWDVPEWWEVLDGHLVPGWGDVHELGDESWRGPASPGDGWRRP